MCPLPWKLREPFFSISGGGGGVLPPTPPLGTGHLHQLRYGLRDLYESFNRESVELPPLEPIEGDLGRPEEPQRFGSMEALRPPDHLGNEEVGLLLVQ